MNRLENLKSSKLRLCKGGSIMEHGKWAQELESKASQVAPAETLIIKVKVEPSELFADAALVYSNEAERVTRFSSNKNFEITPEQFEKYFKTLLYLRISRVNGTENETTRSYKHDIRTYNVPAFVHTLLTSVGKAVDRDFGFEFIPTTSVEVKDMLSPSEMRDVSRKLNFLNVEGLVCVDTGISMRPEGELSFMAVLNIEEEVLSYKKDHPVYGFYAAFFKHTIVDQVLNSSALRVRYGTQSEFATYVRYIV